jgi:HK97 family phage major capsid protein
MKLTDLIARQTAERDKLAALRAEQDQIITAARAALTDDASIEVIDESEARASQARAAAADLDARIAQRDDAIRSLELELADEQRIVADFTAPTVPTGAPRAARAYDEVGRVGQEKRTYSPDNAREGVSFLRDVVSILEGDLDAMQRVQRHKREVAVEREFVTPQKRDVGTGAFAGLTVPQYLTDLVAPAVAAGRPLADNCRQLPLPPDGMSVVISRVTTPTATAVQASENAAVQETDIDDTALTVNVRTIAGQQDMSRQSIDRSVGAEQVVVEDLVRRYNTTLDSQILNNDGTSGTHLGIRSTSSIVAVTYTDTTPTPSEAWGPIWDLLQQIEAGVFMPATHLVMHPRRWAFFLSAIGTNQAMMGLSGAPAQLIGSQGSQMYGPGVRGTLAGVPVIVDANIPTNISSTQDTILAVTNSELFLWEQPGAPLLIRAEQTGAANLSVKLVLYGYSAFTAGRYPGAHGAITGSGLTTPTFGIAAS